jgi:hypothetical protein
MLALARIFLEEMMALPGLVVWREELAQPQ